MKLQPEKLMPALPRFAWLRARPLPLGNAEHTRWEEVTDGSVTHTAEHNQEKLPPTLITQRGKSPCEVTPRPAMLQRSPGRRQGRTATDRHPCDHPGLGTCSKSPQWHRVREEVQFKVFLTVIKLFYGSSQQF